MTSTRDKGHKHELQLTLEAMRNGSPSPIPLGRVPEVSEAAFTVTEVMSSAQTVSLDTPKLAHTAA